jgi:hypothetical protein
MHRLLNGWRTFVLLFTLSLGGGCSRFSYSPTYPASYAPVANRAGLAIRRGKDLRPPDEITPDWCTPAEPIVARALADEVRHANLFDRVEMHARTVNPQKYPTMVECDVLEFDCVPKVSFFENKGRTMLRMLGIRGHLIAASIPSEYTSDVEVQFEVLDTASGRPKFTRTYRAQRARSFNRYQGKTPLMQQTGATLEDVLARFIRDLAGLPSN